jgi:hypothetical protein
MSDEPTPGKRRHFRDLSAGTVVLYVLAAVGVVAIACLICNAIADHHCDRRDERMHRIGIPMHRGGDINGRGAGMGRGSMVAAFGTVESVTSTLIGVADPGPGPEIQLFSINDETEIYISRDGHDKEVGKVSDINVGDIVMVRQAQPDRAADESFDTTAKSIMIVSG